MGRWEVRHQEGRIHLRPPAQRRVSARQGPLRLVGRRSFPSPSPPPPSSSLSLLSPLASLLFWTAGSLGSALRRLRGRWFQERHAAEGFSGLGSAGSPVLHM